MTVSDGAFDLVAVSAELDAPVDSFAAADGGGVVVRSTTRSVAGWGVATRFVLPNGLGDPAEIGAVQRALVAMAAEVDPAHVVAVGAFPFDPRARAELVVPRLVVVEDQGARWATLIAPRAEATAEELRRELAALAAPRSFDRNGPGAARVADLATEAERYAKSVAAALEVIGLGEVEKVVLARSLDVSGPTPFAPSEVVRRLHAQEPDCTTFCLPVRGGHFVGASPELLIERLGRAVRSTPLAGTAALSGERAHDDRQAARLLESAKDRREHGPVVEAIQEALAPRCAALIVPPEPVVVRLHSVVHLATDIRGTLADPGVGVLDLLADLHPTPAVGGAPRDEALSLIGRLEPEGRGLWAGAVGYVDGTADGQWVIGIRSASLERHGSRLFAGAGIVEGSDPAAELVETTVKLQAVLQALYPDGDRLLDGLA